MDVKDYFISDVKTHILISILNIVIALCLLNDRIICMQIMKNINNVK